MRKHPHPLAYSVSCCCLNCSLLLDFPLLCVDLRFRLVLACLLILQFVSDQETATRAERTADRG